jgi:hypothetical protein
MLKKIVVGTLVLGLSGVLVVGGIHRTTDRLERETRSGTDRQEDAAEGFGQRPGGSQGVGQGAGQGEGQGNHGQAADADIQPARENQGNQQGDRDSTYEVAEILQERGVVAAVREDALLVDTALGETLIIEGRTWKYAREQKFQTDVGDQLVLLGFYEDGEWKTTLIENITTDSSLTIRNDRGRPMWAGQGRQNLPRG